MGALASLDQREEVRRSAEGAGRRRAGSRSGTRSGRASAPTPSGRVRVAAAAGRRPRARRAPPGGGLRPGVDGDALTTSTAAPDRTAPPAGGQPGRLGDHRRHRVRPRGRARRPASWHGRLLVLNEGGREGVHRARLAACPRLVHGGPGSRRRRRGDGRDPRGPAPHAADRGAGRPGHAERDHRPVGGRRRSAGQTDRHPFRLHLEELSGPATPWSPGPRRVTQEDVEHFAEFTGDTFYAHMDAAAAAANPLFGERVAHGYLIVSAGRGVVRRPRSRGRCWPTSASSDLRFLTPVKFDDELTVTLTCKQITPRDTRPATARSAGTPTSPARTANRWPATTCSPWWRSRRARTVHRLLIVGSADALPSSRPRGADVGRRAAGPAAGADAVDAVPRLHQCAPLPRGLSTPPACTPTTAAICPIWRGSPPSKADLRENYPFGMFAVPQDKVWRVHASSGTTVKPTVVGYTRRDMDN